MVKDKSSGNKQAPKSKPQTPKEVAEDHLRTAQEHLQILMSAAPIKKADKVTLTDPASPGFLKSGMKLIAAIPANINEDASDATMDIRNARDEVIRLTAQLTKLQHQAEYDAWEENELRDVAKDVEDWAKLTQANEKVKTCPRCQEMLRKAKRAYNRKKLKLKKRRSEYIGEAKMHEFATTPREKGLGYKSRLSPFEATKRPQGFDAVYFDPPKSEGTGARPDGTFVIGEAKGGYNGIADPLKTLGEGIKKGGPQGTLAWVGVAAKSARDAADKAAIEIAKRAAKSKTGLSPEDRAELVRIQKEKDVANQVLDALAKGKVRVEVFHTPHDSGVPIEGTPTRYAVTSDDDKKMMIAHARRQKRRKRTMTKK